MTTKFSLGSGSLISRPQPLVVDHLGPTVEVLTARNRSAAPGLMRGTIPPEVAVPMHSHDEPETFFILDGALEALTFPSPDAPTWVTVEPGQAFHVPPRSRHAFRNRSTRASVALIISTPDMVQFFEQTGRPLRSVDGARTPPTAADVERVVRAADRLGHWLASPQENADVGIDVPPASG